MESKEIAISLWNELEIQSQNRTRPIEHIWYPVQEVVKVTGIKRESVQNVLKKMVELQLLVTNSPGSMMYEFTEFGKRIKQAELEELFDNRLYY